MKATALTLGSFLRAKRAQTAPPAARAGTNRYRRVSGLRREEVANLAGISIIWYTLLEQDRAAGQPSREVLASLARVFALTPAERTYLYQLAQHLAPPQPPEDTSSPALQHLLDQQQPSPAYMLDRYWDVLAWNRPASRLFGDFARMPAAERNMLYRIFVDPAMRRMMVDWERHAQQLVATVRVDAGRNLADAGFAALIGRLRRLSPEFDRWWPRQDIAPCVSFEREYLHPRAGLLRFEQTPLAVDGGLSVRLVLFAPADDRTRTRLELLGA